MPDEDLPPAAEVHPRWMWIWRCWNRLSADRPYYGGGMGPSVPGNIPWWMLRMWAKDHGMTDGQQHMLDVCIRQMDETYRTLVKERQEETPTEIKQKGMR